MSNKRLIKKFAEDLSDNYIIIDKDTDFSLTEEQFEEFIENWLENIEEWLKSIDYE